jgi:hypothetical protein
MSYAEGSEILVVVVAENFGALDAAELVAGIVEPLELVRVLVVELVAVLELEPVAVQAAVLVAELAAEPADVEYAVELAVEPGIGSFVGFEIAAK